jgi:threonyl-tRNA synthetase
MAEEIEDSAKKGRLEEAHCAFIAVEKFDDDDPDAVIAEGVSRSPTLPARCTPPGSCSILILMRTSAVSSPLPRRR